MDQFLKELNKAQYEAVVNTDGPSLVIAGAGSGKTRVLTYRVAYLLSRGVKPSSIICLTFTNKAAREMKDRISRLVGEETARFVWMGTFHSLFARILRMESGSLGYPSSYTIYDTLDSKSLLKTIIGDMKLNDELYKPSDVLGRISWAKNNLITPQAYNGNLQITGFDNATRRPQIGEIYRNYCQRCKRAGAMDFDDLLLNTNILFRDFPAILEKYQEKFRYVLVDEYQDTNYSQYLIVNRLAAMRKNICVVGDDAQSIYSFRGARIENILNFRSDYPEHKLFKLEQNYRSTKAIVEAANSLIAKNNGQIRKVVWSANEDGHPIKIIRSLTDLEEGFVIANSIFDTVLTRQQHYSDFAVLYRTNAQSRIFEEAMRKRNIPYKVYGGISFYQRKEIKDMLAYLRLAVNEKDDEAFRRIVNYPPRGIGEVTLGWLEEQASLAGISLWEAMGQIDVKATGLNRGAVHKLNGFRELMQGFAAVVRQENAFDAARHIAAASGIMKDLYNGDSPEERSRFENLEALLNGIKEFVESAVNENLPARLENYLENVSLLTDLDNDRSDDRDHVTLMTMHSAKGLEFGTVYVAGVEEELFPARQALESAGELEEERRLFYVAITRAKKRVFITYCQNRYRWGVPVAAKPSRFIGDIDPRYLDIPSSMLKDEREDDADEDIRPSRMADRQPGHAALRGQRAGRADDMIRPAGKPFLQVHRQKLPSRQNAGDDFMPDNPDALLEGMEVEHPVFGFGTILRIEGEIPDRKAKVLFRETGEEKQLLLKFARLRIVK